MEDTVRTVLASVNSPSGEIRPHPAWTELDPAGRLEVYEATKLLRRLEAARDPAGLSSTAKAVLARISPR